MKYQNKLCGYIICCIIVILLFVSCVNSENNKKIKDVLELNDKTEVVITEVYYRKQEIQNFTTKAEITISKEQLKELFLEKAVVISGETVNYYFGYETVYISGIIVSNNKAYTFDYNLAGFGHIFLQDKKFIIFGDMSKTIPDH